MKNDDDFFVEKLIEFITLLKTIIISRVYLFSEHFSLLLGFSYLLPVPAYGVRVPPLPHLVCCVSTVHWRLAGILCGYVYVLLFCWMDGSCY